MVCKVLRGDLVHRQEGGPLRLRPLNPRRTAHRRHSLVPNLLPDPGYPFALGRRYIIISPSASTLAVCMHCANHNLIITLLASCRLDCAMGKPQWARVKRSKAKSAHQKVADTGAGGGSSLSYPGIWLRDSAQSSFCQSAVPSKTTSRPTIFLILGSLRIVHPSAKYLSSGPW